jgi:hypothetical protein
MNLEEMRNLICHRSMSRNQYTSLCVGPNCMACGWTTIDDGSTIEKDYYCRDLIR